MKISYQTNDEWTVFFGINNKKINAELNLLKKKKSMLVSVFHKKL